MSMIVRKLADEEARRIAGYIALLRTALADRTLPSLNELTFAANACSGTVGASGFGGIP